MNLLVMSINGKNFLFNRIFVVDAFFGKGSHMRGKYMDMQQCYTEVLM